MFAGIFTFYKTGPVSGFVEREYASEHKVICTDLLSLESFAEYLQFKVDFTAPTTQIVLQEGTRAVTPQGYGWEEFFINSTQISFECDNDGFECVSTFYCLGDGCELVNSPNYKEFGQVITLNKNSLICYYSTDLADNPVYQPTCGMIRVEGY